MIKKPWAFIRVSLYETYYFGVIGPGLLNQVTTIGRLGLKLEGCRFRVGFLGFRVF